MFNLQSKAMVTYVLVGTVIYFLGCRGEAIPLKEESKKEESNGKFTFDSPEDCHRSYQQSAESEGLGDWLNCHCDFDRNFTVGKLAFDLRNTAQRFPTLADRAAHIQAKYGLGDLGYEEMEKEHEQNTIKGLTLIAELGSRIQNQGEFIDEMYGLMETHARNSGTSANYEGFRKFLKKTIRESKLINLTMIDKDLAVAQSEFAGEWGPVYFLQEKNQWKMALDKISMRVKRATAEK